MGDPAAQASNGASLEYINQHSQSSLPRRTRPPGAETERVPLRSEKLGRRESRLGLRNLFGRNKVSSPDPDKEPASPRETPSRTGLRASLAEISHWPYGLHQLGQKSELALPSFSKSPPPVSPGLKHKRSASVVRNPVAQDGPKGNIASWNPPPLFQAYPQAVKHAHLPACTASADTVLRLHHHKSSLSLGMSFGHSSSALDVLEETTGEKDDRSGWRSRRDAPSSLSKLEWTSKVYILVTSGYLLQYSGEGTYDRLPERVLQLGKDSAAFASDVIPGRHWVLQVSSVAEPDRQSPSSSSFLARLPFRAQERRGASHLLIVFESADEMEAWITTLRREIEGLGGRRYLSETGKPINDDEDIQLKSQASQRTLVVRDPDRFSRIASPDLTWERIQAVGSQGSHLDVAGEDVARDQSFDETSTASVISNEGRQLDSLRDSTNRFSCVSSGQRTFITSDGSSPSCSPARDALSDSELPLVPEFQSLDEQPQPRLRPNAAAISDRRQSLQTANHFLEMRVASAQVLQARLANDSQQPDAVASSAPNFSIPHSVSKRYSICKSPPPTETARMSAPASQVRTSCRRPPPAALSLGSRPLSLVEDLPSPASSPPSGDGIDTAVSATSFYTEESTPSPTFSAETEESRSRRGSSAPADSSSPVQIVTHSPQRASMPSSMLSSEDQEQGTQTHRISLPIKITSPNPRTIQRAQSSMGSYGRNQWLVREPVKQASRERRRSSFSAQKTSSLLSPLSSPDVLGSHHRIPYLKPVPKSSQPLRADLAGQALLQRRSLSQLAEGPPPAPPPTKALPPIPPRKISGPNMF